MLLGLSPFETLFCANPVIFIQMDEYQSQDVFGDLLDGSYFIQDFEVALNQLYRLWITLNNKKSMISFISTTWKSNSYFSSFMARPMACS